MTPDERAARRRALWGHPPVPVVLLVVLAAGVALGSQWAGV